MIYDKPSWLNRYTLAAILLAAVGASVAKQQRPDIMHSQAAEASKVPNKAPPGYTPFNPPANVKPVPTIAKPE